MTVGTYTYTTDQRFQTAFHRETNEWTLHIKWAQKRDAGMYECQVSTIPIKSYSVRLNVVGKLTTPNFPDSREYPIQFGRIFFLLPLISFQFDFSLFFFIFLRLFSLCFHNDPLDGPPDRYYENDQQNGFLNDGSSDVDGSGWENNSNDGGVSIPITQHPS